jgi:hypothetical protein
MDRLGDLKVGIQIEQVEIDIDINEKERGNITFATVMTLNFIIVMSLSIVIQECAINSIRSSLRTP